MSTGSVRWPKRESASRPGGGITTNTDRTARLAISPRQNLLQVGELASSPASLFALDITGSTVESTGLGLDIGDADRICYPIPGTLSMEPWQKRPTAQLLMTMHELEGDPFFADPREVLRQVVARFTEMELTIVAAFELEFYLIDQENVNGRPQPPRSPISGKRPQSVQVYSIDDLDEYVECLQDIIDGARAQGIPADAIVAESAPAQFEVNLSKTPGGFSFFAFFDFFKYDRL